MTFTYLLLRWRGTVIGEMVLPLLLIALALLIIGVTVAAATWDSRKNKPRAEKGIEELSGRLKAVPGFAQSECSAALEDIQALYGQGRYRECIKRADRASGEIDQLMEIARQGRAELRSIEAKVEDAGAHGLVIDRGAIGLDSVSRFWGNGE
jgi:hypothetical protein